MCINWGVYAYHLGGVRLSLSLTFGTLSNPEVLDALFEINTGRPFVFTITG